MEIEYIYNNDNDDKELEKEINRLKKQSTLSGLITILTALVLLFIFLALLPFILVILGYSILGLGIYILYKAYLEQHILNFIQKHNLRR